MKEQTILQWRLLLPAGLGLLCGGEFLIAMGLDGILSLENKTLLLIALSVGGAVLTTLLFYLISWAMTILLYVAPHQRTGVTLLAAAYGAVKVVWLLADLLARDWSGLMISLLFISIFAYVLYDAQMGKLDTSTYLT